jgi:hypothetical protein
VLHAPSDGKVVNRFLHRPGYNVEPHRRLVLLSNSIYAGNCLQLEGSVEKGLTQEDVACIDEIKAAGVRSCMEEKALYGRVFLESLNSVRIVN